MKKHVLFLMLMAILAVFAASCKDPNPVPPQDDQDPSGEQPVDKPTEEPAVELENLKLSIPVTGDEWIFADKPVITIHAENPNAQAMTADAKVIINTDKGKKVVTLTQSVEVAAKGSADITFTTEEALDPGFYRAICTVNRKPANIMVEGALAGKKNSFVFGISPEEIVSAPDKQDDFDAFWDETLAQLEAVEMNPTLIEIPKFSSAARKVYLVEMQSLPDGLSGDPVLIHGYYLEPQDGKKHPVIMHYYGYDDLHPYGKIFCPYGGSSAEYAEFYLSTRGQIINNRTADQREDGIDLNFQNAYGDWFAFHFGQRDSYYYRGAFMDVVQGIRFMATRETSDMNNVFAEGKSQGGAFSYAAAALSPYPLRAVAPGVAFLGDFPDYFDIVSWPANVAKTNKGAMTNEEMYQFLSYFDTKNLATRIHCAVIANICLQDETCPPHTNIAPFNNLSNPDKKLYFYPLLGHDIPGGWDNRYLAFFNAHIVSE